MLYDQKWELDEIGKALHRAADLIEDRGWCQGISINYKGNICAETAISIAVRSDSELILMRGRVCKHLGIQIVARWNDLPETTQEMVVTALRAAACVP
jgi:hypothetical protein